MDTGANHAKQKNPEDSHMSVNTTERWRLGSDRIRSDWIGSDRAENKLARQLLAVHPGQLCKSISSLVTK
jgi:hypothetical protein